MVQQKSCLFSFSVNPCELHCRPVNEYFSEKMVDAVIDGTRCYEGSQSRDMCINGICKVSRTFELSLVIHEKSPVVTSSLWKPSLCNKRLQEEQGIAIVKDFQPPDKSPACFYFQNCLLWFRPHTFFACCAAYYRFIFSYPQPQSYSCA